MNYQIEYRGTISGSTFEEILPLFEDLERTLNDKPDWFRLVKLVHTPSSGDSKSKTDIVVFVDDLDESEVEQYKDAVDDIVKYVNNNYDVDFGLASDIAKSRSYKGNLHER